MIITLAPSFAMFSEEDWDPYLPAIHHLIQAHIQGWHFFVPDRQSIVMLTNHPKLPERIREILSVTIGERLSVLQGYAGTATVTIQCENPFVHSVIARDRIRVDLNEFGDLDNCLKTKLIVENAESDGVFYMMAAKELAALGTLMPSVALELVAGGGHTTAHRVTDAVASIRPSVTIVDGDKTFPTSVEGATAVAVRAAFAGRSKPTHRLLVTKVRALENFIPYSQAKSFLLDSSARQTANKLAIWQQDERNHSTSIDQCVTAFYGPRKGLKKRAYRLSSESFKKRVDALCMQLGIAFTAPDPQDASQDRDFIVPPLSTEYARLFIDAACLIKKTVLCKETLDSPFFEHLQEIADCVVSFGAAPLKLPFGVTA